jgi:hypothetical protein
MSLCALINAIACGGKSSPYVAAKVGGCVYVGIPIPKVDSFSSLGERRYLARILHIHQGIDCFVASYVKGVSILLFIHGRPSFVLLILMPQFLVEHRCTTKH